MRDSETLAALQARLGVIFRNEEHLLRALRHRSASLDQPRESNERMEFLGDSIVGMIVCDYLFEHFPEASEGELAKAKAFLASEPTLAQAGFALGLDEALELSVSEEASGGRQRRSIVADAFEAIVAAVYLDSGVRAARKLVRSALAPSIRLVARDEHYHDYKSLLQERLQAKRRKPPRYKIALETGADHDKTFLAQAYAGSRMIGEGSGRSKKQAEQSAAQDALEKMDASADTPAPEAEQA